MRGVENVVWEKSQNRQLLRGPACQKKVGGGVRGRHVIKYMTYLYVDVYHGNKLLRIYQLHFDNNDPPRLYLLSYLFTT